MADRSFTLHCDLNLDLMNFKYELDLYSMEIHWMCYNELPRQIVRKLSYYSLQMYAFSYAWSLLVGGHVTKMVVTPVDLS